MQAEFGSVTRILSGPPDTYHREKEDEMQASDTMELRRKFAEKFLAAPQEHEQAILDGPMDTLIDEFDTELAAARKRYRSLNIDAEWAEMDSWLAEHDYVDPMQVL